ncbi:MAG: epoxyqueuosine reductase QueH [Desulfovibrionaceae bacterium]|nr:epoxyqueuosine reductase QueH [Desulfovibrionaceae bacterium]
MNILLHICCGPCAIMPILRLQEEGHSLTGFFYNPNIHPLGEYLRRREGTRQVAERLGIPMIWATEPEDYAPDAWMAQAQARPEEAPGVPGKPGARCVFCLGLRLERAGGLAVGGFDAFSTSLLYSRRQSHDFIAGRGAESGREIPFLYRDFRRDWERGIRLSREWNIYRQQYCGCLFSEYDRHARDLSASNARLRKTAADRR